jgi:peptide deformylase
MSILKVARMGHPVLRERARPVEPSELKHVLMQKLIDDMIETMDEYHGVGLAGPQVHEDLRIFVALLEEDPGPKTEPMAIINPQIVPVSEATAEGWEGCLSVPDVRGMVPRYTDVTVRALNRKGKTVEIPLKGFAARIAQHETDHLDGVLFFDRMVTLQSLTYLDEYSRYHAKSDDEE